MDFGITGRRALIGGGGRGIGKAIALELAREGVDCVIASRTLSELEKSAKEIEDATGRRCIPMALDVTKKDQVARVVADTVQQLGGLDILVNSASLPGGSAGAVGPIETVIEEELINDFDVKYVGALRCAQACIPIMKEGHWGRIINISGGNARIAGNLSGGVRNAGLVHMAKTLSTQVGRFGITVNCIHPGVTRTERTPGMLAARATQLGITPEAVEEADFAPDSPRGNDICRMVDASEVAYMTVFLASEQGFATTGELISVNGGSGRAVYY